MKPAIKKTVWISWGVVVAIIVAAMLLTGCSTLEGYSIASKACYVDKDGNRYCLSSEGKKIFLEADIQGFAK